MYENNCLCTYFDLKHRFCEYLYKVSTTAFALANGPPWHTFRQSFIFNPCLKSGGLKTDILVEISTTILWAITFSKNTQYKLYVPVLLTRPPKQASGSAASWPNASIVYALLFMLSEKKNYWSATLVLKMHIFWGFFKMAAKAPLENRAKLRLFMREVYLKG